MKEFRLKGGDKILNTISSFSATEKVIFGLFVIVALITALNLLRKVNDLFLVSIPSYGGSFSEGVVGLPRSINPVLAFTDTDRDLSTLIYSGLMKYENNKLVKDLASSYTVSEDGLVYDFKINTNLRFHDGTQLTTDDIEFTIQKIQDADIKSPRRADWASVIIKKISNTEIQFTLKQPYAPFLANTTIGIIPKSLWKNLDADQFVFSEKNLNPVGSGPYQIGSITKDTAGIPTSYTLNAFDKYNNGKPFISEIKINFYQNEDDVLNAFKSGAINNFAGISPQKAHSLASSTNNLVMIHNPLPRIFGVFFNQNNSAVLANKEIRQALDMAVDKDQIVKKVLYNYAVSIDGPLPIDINSTSTGKTVSKFDKQGAKSLLAKNGWVINSDGVMAKKIGGLQQTLEIGIATADSDDLKNAASLIKKDWEDIGAKVTIKVFEYGDLSQNIIKTRKYDALLFGEIISKDLDLYAFWHSSQRNSPGLNISMYVNSRADNLLEDIRTTTDPNKRADMYQALQKIIRSDVPAVFIYSPEYIYIMSDNIKGYNIKSIANHSERFYGIEKWYITMDHVWKIFANNNK